MGSQSTLAMQIADTMGEWEGHITEQLGLTWADINDTKTQYPGKLKLQTGVSQQYYIIIVIMV